MKQLLKRLHSALKTLQTIQPGDHLCCIYQYDDEHKAVVTPFLKQGLERNHKVFYITDTRSSATIVSYLEEAGMKTDSYLQRGQLVFLTQNDSYVREGIFDPDRMIALLRAETAKALDEGFAALRVTGEMTWALRGFPGSDRLIEYEVKLNQFMPENPCVAICQYDRRRFSAHILLDVLRTHPFAVIGTEIYNNIYYIPPEKLLQGDADEIELTYWLDTLAERKHIEEVLKDLARFPAENPNPVLRGTKDGRIVYANHASRCLLESWECHYDVQEDGELNTSGPCLPDNIRQAILQVFESGTPENLEVLCRERTFSLTIAPLPEGKYANLYGYDITALKRAEESRLREIQALESFSGTSRSTVTAASFNLKPLHESAPGRFDELIQSYKRILELAVEEKVYKVNHNVSEQLRLMAEPLGFVRAGPRDVVNIHITALKRKTAGQTALKAQAYTEIGRLLLLELMGYLVSYYRLRTGQGRFPRTFESDREEES